MLKPQWLNKKVKLSSCHKVKSLLRDLKLSTVCEEALCPNISECFEAKIATFMILGDSCTRKCKFCAIKRSQPQPLDYQEPTRVKQAIERLGLNYVVITSPTRDDLADGGGEFFALVIYQIKTLANQPEIEVLIPDFLGDKSSLQKVVEARPKVIAHNLETVPSLYGIVRDGNYFRSLNLLAQVKKLDNKIKTKSGIMLGLGETKEEVYSVLNDLRKIDCDFLTLGQYLAPSRTHYPVKKYILPEEFSFWQEEAQKLGFSKVKSSAYVRSSYLAEE